MRAVRRGVEEQVRMRVAREVLLVRQRWAEHEARGRDVRARGLRPQPRVRVVGTIEQPQHARRHRLQHREQPRERGPIEFPAVVEAGEHDRVRGQPVAFARLRRDDASRRV
ncbi:MAG: hypothetical protein EOP90_10860 [Lysobacteraceae bacterium]|nr:MAG: hypothetical protein EOP90_10860 [Xanthomonadaceae bacterium]